ncbi:uncharacterized protein LOC135107037 isoform X2 [Scylla paramamosain]|uniref:uncharacterized protein LOC135107037 isoform X2 n=1 Tax=Scylla paramamosain TaxID=85552 RepID=UPI003083E983
MADLLGSVFFRTQFAVTVVQDRHSLAGGLLPTVQQVKMQLRCSEVRAANSLDDYSEIDFIAGKNNGIIIQGESLPAAVCCLLCYCDHTETNTLSYHPRHIKAQPYPLQWRCGPLPPPPLPFPTRPLDSTLRVSQEGIQTLSESTPSCLVRLQRLELRETGDVFTLCPVKRKFGLSAQRPTRRIGAKKCVPPKDLLLFNS